MKDEKDVKDVKELIMITAYQGLLNENHCGGVCATNCHLIRNLVILVDT